MDPSRPAVICGTVDMIGSRLLFGGYRIGFKAKPLHAGFLGQDALLVHDEAHLEPAFQKLIESIEIEQTQNEPARRELALGDEDQLPWPSYRIMSLSATTRTGEESQTEDNHTNVDSNDKCHTIRLTQADRKHKIVDQRINATKDLELHPIATTDTKGKHLSDNNLRKALVAKIEKLATAHGESDAAVLIFLQTVDAVKELSGRLPSAQTAQLTGTLRGLERDALVNTAIFQRFLPPSNRDKGVEPKSGTVFLICTSAGEVGVNISADHLVCDLSTFDSMAQRFGRVNRFGKCEDTKIDVVYPAAFGKKDKKGKLQITEFDVRRELTLTLLDELNRTASPAALDKLDSRRRVEAFAPPPTILPATDILFDAWAMTTVRKKMPGRAPLEPYLHGISQWEPPQTCVAWREDVERLCSDELLERYSPESLLEDYPLKSCELARDKSERVFGELKKLAKPNGDVVVWIVESDGTVETVTLSSIVEDDEARIHHCTVLLPPKVGGFENGLLNGSAEHSSDCQYDISDRWLDEDGQLQRCRVLGNVPPAGMALIRSLDLSTSENEETDDQSGRWNWYVQPRAADNITRASPRPISWEHHTNDVVERITQIVQQLSIANQPLGKALIFAARVHDLGKRREQWQRSIGNPNPEKWYAKPGKPDGEPRWIPRRLSQYRHEFGSLIDLLDRSQEFHAQFEREFDADMQALILHVVATHHGRARPHFPSDETFDTKPGAGGAAQAQATEVPRRFARLQRNYGRWRLAYIESILRAADWAASADPSEAQS